MNQLLVKLESTLEPLFKSLPEISPRGREKLVRFWPTLALVFGVLQLLAGMALWRLGHRTNEFVDYANQLSQVYGTQRIHHLSFFYWLGLVTIFVDAIILLVAVSPLKQHAKRGWDLLFMATTINLVYGVVITFDDSYGGAGRLVSSLVGSAIAYYLLFQTKPLYEARKTAATPRRAAAKKH